MVVEELAQAGENGKMRSVLWDGLGFAAWKYPIMVEALKERLEQEVRYSEAPNGAGKREGSSRDTAAKRFGTCATGQVVFGGDEWRDWTLEGVPASRRERIVGQVCSHFDREEEVRSAGGWEKVVKPMWDEILTLQSGGGDAVTARGAEGDAGMLRQAGTRIKPRNSRRGSRRARRWSRNGSCGNGKDRKWCRTGKRP